MKVQTTRDYDQFRSVMGNRNIDWNHVNHLIELNSKENRLWMFPSLVTKDNYLFDGQHRREVARTQNWEFPFIVSDKTLKEMGEESVALTNTAQKSWSVPDYINFWLTREKPQYVFLKHLISSYKISHANIIVLVSGKSQQKPLKRGELELYHTDDDRQYIEEAVKGYADLKEVLPKNVYTHAAFAAALRTMYQHATSEMIKAEVIRASVPVIAKRTTQEYLRMFEEIFNYRKAEKNHVRFF